MIKDQEVVKPARVLPVSMLKQKKEPTANLNLCYIEFFRENTNLQKYKIIQLKSVAKTNKLHITGSKQTLITRIKNYFNSMKNATKIQSIMKGYFVRRYFKLIGDSFIKRSECLNETDFYTLEPIKDIPFQEFYSYIDSKNFTYGFNIQSLITLYRKKRYTNDDIINPYNRDIIDTKIKDHILFLYDYIKIVFPDHILDEDKRNNIPIIRPIARRSIVRRIPPIVPLLHLPVRTTSPVNTIITTPIRILGDMHEIIAHERNNIIWNGDNITENVNVPLTGIRATLSEIRRKPTETRIQELFMEIDQLGNYTDCSWFNDLGKRNLYLFYLTLHEHWVFRAHIPGDIKDLICPLGNPFLNIPNRIRYDEYEEEDLCRICLYVMENIILTARDIEYRKIGTLHVLTALTVHSLPAREAMMWLYESIY